MEIIKLSKKSISEAVNFLNNNGVVIFATDTIYGFLADASSKKAVAKIYKIKKRPKSKPLPVFVKDLKMAKDFAEIDGKQLKILKQKWFTRRSIGEGGPSKFTFILERNKGVKLYDGGGNTIALRVPKYKPLNDLLKKINKPLAQTSVNISGQPPILKSEEIIIQFGKVKDLLFIDAGNFKRSTPSKIIDLTEQKTKIIRK